MKQKSYELFEKGSIDEIVEYLDRELKVRNESPFWADKVVPFSKAILSVLFELRDMGLLFDPQGDAQTKLTPELFVEWSDFVSLKTLAFTLQLSNQKGELVRTKLTPEQTQNYKQIDLTLLGEYLSKNSVNLEREHLDFPISTYNLHQGVTNVIVSLLR